MIKLVLLRLHRWTGLVFALPLRFVIAAGLILSFEPIVQVSGIVPQSVDASRVVELIKSHDPEGKARAFNQFTGTQPYASRSERGNY
jgi:uncharacterized iron-regulated membrane protein